MFDAKRRGALSADDTLGQIEEARKHGIISAAEAKQITTFDRQVMALIAVDDFSPDDLTRNAPDVRKKPRRKPTAKKKAKRKTSGGAKKRPSRSD